VRGQYTLEYTGANPDAAFNADLQKLKSIYGNNNVQAVNSCGCNNRKLYSIPFFNSIFGEEKDKKGRQEVASNLGKEGVEPNYYLLLELEQLAPHSAEDGLPPNFMVIPSGKPAQPVVVALLDTGIDPHFQLTQTTSGWPALYLWDNPEGSKDKNCYKGDVIGWDFVNNDNAPIDDHSHGTHVASRIAQQLAELCAKQGRVHHDLGR
jgi:subtilisin family serine protease